MGRVMKPGDKIKTTKLWNGAKYTGVLIKPHRDDPRMIRVRRDGVKEIETWHRDYWHKA